MNGTTDASIPGIGNTAVDAVESYLKLVISVARGSDEPYRPSVPTSVEYRLNDAGHTVSLRVDATPGGAYTVDVAVVVSSTNPEFNDESRAAMIAELKKHASEHGAILIEGDEQTGRRVFGS